VAASERVMDDISSILRRWAQAEPERPFLTFTETGERLTYGAFNDRVNRMANGLATLGVKHGSPVNLMLPNCVEYLVVAYALRRLGAIEVAINNQSVGAGLSHMLRLAGAQVLITASEYAAQVETMRTAMPAPSTVLVVGDPSAFGGTWEQSVVKPLADIEANEADDDPMTPVGQLDAAVVIFTSGTTGPPKGCILSHRCQIRSAESVRDAMGLRGDDVCYSPFPLFHARASELDVLGALLVGAQVVLAPRFSASRFWADMVRFQVTVFSIIGTVMQILWKQPPSDLDRAHKVRITWGGPITVEPADFEARFGVKVLPGAGVFGMSETGIVTMSDFDPAISGKVRPMYEVIIADDADQPLPRGDTGEILVRPREPGVLYSGYMNMPAETVAASRNLWFHTGDLGRLDDEDRLVFLGRKRDVIRRAGQNISAWEIEQAVDAHPLVLESAAIPVPSALGEDEVKLYVALRPGARLEAAEMLAHCRTQLAPFMLPQHVEFLAELPKTQTGKPAKAALLALHQATVQAVA
jgi:crotonobetaine/carnitine-CoA ligase